ncbi:hypothetical protein MNBD_NITROSPINAE02-1587, partial [hydrothermal vent metagenome]
PLGAPGPQAIDYFYIIRRNIFNSDQSQEYVESLVRAPSPGVGVGIDIAGDDAPKTTLNLTLVGTVLPTDGHTYFAAIENKDTGEQRLYRLGETVSDATIVKIERNRALLKRGENIEALEIDFSLSSKGSSSTFSQGVPARRGGVISRVGKGEYLVSKKYVDDQLKNMNKLLTQVRAIPNLDKSGATNGFKLFSIKKGSVFDKLGLKNRDLVKRVNGVELNSVENGLELFQALRNETSFEVDVVRGSKNTTLKFNLQ